MGARTLVERGIYSRNGRFQVIVTGRDRAGRKVQLSGTADTLKEARVLRKRLIGKSADVVTPTTPRWSTDTLGSWLEHWHSTVPVLDRWSPSTTNVARYTIKVITEHLGHIPLRELDTPTISRFYASLLARGLAHATVVKHHTVLHAALNRAIDEGKLGVNPARSPRRDSHTTPVRPPEPSAVLRLLDAAPYSLRVFLTVSAASGARRGEVCGLRWCDMADDGTLIVLSIVQRVVLGSDGPTVVGATKNGSTRRVTLDPVASEVLRAWHTHCLERSLATGWRMPDTGFVFSEENHRRPWRPDSITHAFSRVRNEAGLPHFRLHDLRHYHATMLVEAGHDYRNVAERLGHQPRMTIGLYAHPSERVDREMAATVEKMWGIL